MEMKRKRNGRSYLKSSDLALLGKKLKKIFFFLKKEKEENRGKNQTKPYNILNTGDIGVFCLYYLGGIQPLQSRYDRGFREFSNSIKIPV